MSYNRQMDCISESVHKVYSSAQKLRSNQFNRNNPPITDNGFNEAAIYQGLTREISIPISFLSKMLQISKEYKELVSSCNHTFRSMEKLLSASDYLSRKAFESFRDKLNSINSRDLNDKEPCKLDLADSATGNISVFCKLTDRHRHLSKHDNRSTLSFQLPNSQTLMIQNGAQKRVYEFNKVFDIDSTIMDINKQLKGPICNLQHGVNLCIMAYGQTGSGKTTTISSLIEKSIGRVFDEDTLDFIELSAIEIHNEQLKDLLSMPIPSKSGILTHKSIKKAQSLSIKVIEGETVVHGAKIHKSNSFFDTLKVLEDIQSKRTIASTFMNSKSTRAHLILTLKTFWRNGVASKLTFADLAGSERLGRNALGMESPQKDELRSINLSLTALNDVFEAIRKKSKFIPYRNSKLTYLLQDTLVPCDDPSRKGGSAIMICHISTSPAQLKETLCSLQFAVRSRGISLLQSRPNIADATKSISKGLTNEAELEKTRVRLSTALKRIEELETKLRQANRKLLFEQDKNKKNHHSVKSRADTAWCLPRSPIPRFMTPTRTKYTSLSNKNAKLSPVRFWED